MSGLKPNRIVAKLDAVKPPKLAPEYELELSSYLRSQYSQPELIGLYERFAVGDGDFDALMRRVIWRAVARQVGQGVIIDNNVSFKHLETFEIGDQVFIGSQSYIQGSLDGRCALGNRVWIGPQSYLEARNLVIEDYVSCGPGVKILGSTQTGLPIEVPLIQTDLAIKPVRLEFGADIGINAVILPGVTVGRNSIVGAGALVTKDVPPLAVVAGVPARFLSWREENSPLENQEAEK